MNNLVSVIIPCYNQAQFLPDTLNSVLEQSYANWECIMVNDGSPDNTEEVAKEWAAKDERFKYYKKENGGLSDTRNFGIRHSKGIYILPLDSDDKISSTYMEEAVQILSSQNKIRVVYGKAEFFGNKSGIWKLPNFSTKEILFRNIVYCSAFFHKEDYLKTSGYDVNLKTAWEDWDLWLSLLELGCTFYQIPKVHFYYRVRGNSMIRSLTKKEMDLINKQIFKKHIDLYLSELGPPQEAYQKFNFLKNSFLYRSWQGSKNIFWKIKNRYNK